MYTYVTKRLVDPHLRGWQSNVMDHHYSKHMYLLRTAPAGTAAPPQPAPGAEPELPGGTDAEPAEPADGEENGAP
ncbi:MAG: hypothetical protein P8008_06160 [Gammaproteobacteria bacterium]